MMLIPLYGLPVLKLRGNGPPVKCGDFHGFSHGITPALRLAMMRSVTVWYRLNFGPSFVGAFLLMGAPQLLNGSAVAVLTDTPWAWPTPARGSKCKGWGISHP